MQCDDKGDPREHEAWVLNSVGAPEKVSLLKRMLEQNLKNKVRAFRKDVLSTAVNDFSHW